MRASRRRFILALAAVGIVLAGLFVWLVWKQPLRRRALLTPRRTPTTLPRKRVLIASTPVGQWTSQFRALVEAAEWEELAEELAAIASRLPAEYAKLDLAWLHARSLIESDDLDEAKSRLEPFLVAGNPYRDLALFHRTTIALEEDEPEQAARYRAALIAEHPGSLYAPVAVDDQLDWFTSKEDLTRVRHGAAVPYTSFTELKARLYPSATTQRRRDLDSRHIELLAREGQMTAAVPMGLLLLRGSTSDDAAERVFRIVDRPEIVSTLSYEEWVLLGETAKNHRHFDRAVALLSLALPKLPLRTDELSFAIGRSHFGAERYREAEGFYLRGANVTKDPKTKATLLFHASRCSQLLGEDALAERLMTNAIAVPGKFPATAAALTQRMRTRLKAKRMGEARSDLAQLRRLFPSEHSLVEASIALANAELAAGDSESAIRSLDAIPRKLLDSYDQAEIAYWKARALEGRDPVRALELYLGVLRARVPTHFAYFARERLGAPLLEAPLSSLLTRRGAEVESLLVAKEIERARQLQTDIVLLSSDRASTISRLRTIYEGAPSYAAIMSLKEPEFPSFSPLSGLAAVDRTRMLMAMGLFDEVVDEVPSLYSLGSPSSAYARSLALSLGSASRESIYAIEVMMKSVPDDFVPDLLPLGVRELLYPRYFYELIVEDSVKYDADPRLVLSIMREESRFNPRAKSEAAARGLLQFIITTAREVGRDLGIGELTADDLYDPRIIIQLGSKYIGTLLGEFDGNGYRAAAAYNSGPNQVRLWLRMTPSPGDDYFLSAINFDETKHYVRKVLNSYARYGEIYEQRGAAGGVRVEP